MGKIEVIILAIALSMDAFAVSICKGVSLKKVTVKSAVIIGLYFGIFQAVMPLFGYFCGAQFKESIVAVDHWIAFVLLVFIGLNMIKEAFGKEEDQDESLGIKTMLMLAIATSIDALAVGITFAFLKVNNIFIVVTLIGVITFTLSIFGVQIGSLFGSKLKSKAEFAGGVVLICIGFKILMEHMGIIRI